MVLTGGSSRRMGVDKAAMSLGGLGCAFRVAEALTEVADPVVEVGPGYTSLTQVTEPEPGSGPLTAVVAGARKLWSMGWCGSVLVLACDLPRVTPALLEMVGQWPGDTSVVPLVGGRWQPLLARWSHRSLEEAASAADGGQRSLRGHPWGGVLLDESVWGTVASWEALADVDTPQDVLRLGFDLVSPEKGPVRAPLGTGCA